MSPKSQLSKAKNWLIAEITFALIALVLTTWSGFLTILIVACKSKSALAPNKTLYFTG